MADLESQEIENVENAPSNDPLKPSTKLSAGWRILILISFVAAVGALALVAMNAQNYQRLREEITLEQGLAQRLQNAQQKVDAQLNQQQNAMQNLLSNLDQLRSSTNKDPVSPVLVEVDYLARLANYNAQYVGDAKVVLALLETAEHRVSSLSSPQLADVRSALVSSITALKGIKPVDIEGVLLRLNALSATVSDLPVVHQTALVSAETKTKEATTPVPTGKSDWKEKLISNLSSIKNVVVVQRLSESVKPLISPEQHINLVENIQLKLAIAQWAALHREPAIYTAALAQAKDWVSHNFSDSEMTRAVIAGLTELDKVEIKPHLPDFASMVSVIDRAMEVHQQTMAKSVDVQRLENKETPAASGQGSTNTTPSGSKNAPPAQGAPTPASPLKAKPDNEVEPEAISS